MGMPILEMIFDRKKVATSKKEGSVELRITYQRKQRYLATGVRLLPKHWRGGQVTNRLDAWELQQQLDSFMKEARGIVHSMLTEGVLDMGTLTRDLKARMFAEAEAVCERKSFLDFIGERVRVRKYGKAEDTGERYDRFVRWFSAWGKIVWFEDVTDANIIRMDEDLAATGMKNYSKWNNYHRFLNSFILDAIDEGYLRRNPYKWLNIEKEKSSGGLGKYLSPEEFRSIEHAEVMSGHLERVRDVFVFQTYTCLSYVDLLHFDASKIKDVNGKKVYAGKRGKTKQEFSFLLLKPALDVLEKYGGVLPVISNVKYNEYLKALALCAGVNKPVSSHWARHTGATLLLNVGGVDMEVVAKVLGHSSTKITRQVYAKLLDETVVDAMSKVERRLSH